mmetsp:Transcript_11072/g.27627  ORF Transcript_11072/g.27627 Transcript_11072/m.27627 type:complete len:238 (+) Transcript_11072:261-974(+)
MRCARNSTPHRPLEQQHRLAAALANRTPPPAHCDRGAGTHRSSALQAVECDSPHVDPRLSVSVAPSPSAACRSSNRTRFGFSGGAPALPPSGCTLSRPSSRLRDDTACSGSWAPLVVAGAAAAMSSKSSMMRRCAAGWNIMKPWYQCGCSRTRQRGRAQSPRLACHSAKWRRTDSALATVSWAERMTTVSHGRSLGWSHACAHQKVRRKQNCIDASPETKMAWTSLYQSAGRRAGRA